MTLFVGNVPYHVSKEEIEQCFSQWGDVHAVRMIHDDEGNFKGFCFVDMSDRDALLAIEQLAGREWSGKKLRVARAMPRYAPIG